MYAFHVCILFHVFFVFMYVCILYGYTIAPLHSLVNIFFIIFYFFFKYNDIFLIDF